MRHKFNLKIALVVGACALANTAQAQFIADGVETNSAAGPLVVIDSGDGFSRSLLVGDETFFTDGTYRFISIEAQRGALYLIALSSGGSACAAEYVWLHTEGGDARLSEQFGTCAVVDEVTSDAETVTVTMQSLDAADGYVSFAYDGQVIREEIAGQRTLGLGFDAAAWEGRYPFEVFSDAEWREPLIALMGEDAYRRAGNTIEVSSPMVAEGAWLTGRGCRSRMCDFAWGALAIHTDGRIVVALRTKERGLEVYGTLDANVPTPIAGVIAGR